MFKNEAFTFEKLTNYFVREVIKANTDFQLLQTSVVEDLGKEKSLIPYIPDSVLLIRELKLDFALEVLELSWFERLILKLRAFFHLKIRPTSRFKIAGDKKDLQCSLLITYNDGKYDSKIITE